MSILDKILIAIRFDGKSFVVYDVVKLIKDYGVYDYGKSWYRNHFGVTHYIKDHSYGNYGIGAICRYEYVLEDGLGNIVDINFLVSEFYRRFPFYRPYKLYDYRRPKTLCRARSYSGAKLRDLKAYSGVVLEDGEPPMKRRFVGNYKFDDCYYGVAERNWKSQRKTQWK